mmetsp:Transcript_49542/g.108187  ORF Transcript_49542/g.108187 Transcript_49542/m.108187 type:complete len:151 (+) Transcript_49542:945-1397(+)
MRMWRGSLWLVPTPIPPKWTQRNAIFIDLLDGCQGLSGTIARSFHAQSAFFHSPMQRVAKHVRNCLIVTNIPYGEAAGRDRAKKLYRDFGRMVQSRTDWQGVYVVSARREFKAMSGLEWRVELRFSNGGIRVELLRWTGRTKTYAEGEDD